MPDELRFFCYLCSCSFISFYNRIFRVRRRGLSPYRRSTGFVFFRSKAPRKYTQPLRVLSRKTRRRLALRSYSLHSFVRRRGLEPPFPNGSYHLKVVRLPISPPARYALRSLCVGGRETIAEKCSIINPLCIYYAHLIMNCMLE